MRRTLAAGILGAALTMVAGTAVWAAIPDTDLAYLTASSSNSNSEGFFTSFFRPLLSVLLFGSFLLGALYYAYRRRAKESGSDVIQVLASSQIAQGVVVQIVDAAGILYIITLSRNGPALLGQVTDREKISEIRTRVSQEAVRLALPPIPFKKSLERLFRKPGDAETAEKSRPSARESMLHEALERVRRLNPTKKDPS